MARIMNFNAGPAALPLPALERAKAELTDFAGSGMSVMEHSHRGKEYEKVHDEAIALLRKLLGVPDSYEVLFVQGGASQLFAQIPMNLLGKGAVADYVITGAWGEKALSEAKTTAALLGGEVKVACTTGTGEGKEKSYVRTPAPSEVKPTPGAAYLHVTSNETIHGVEYEVDPSRPFPPTGGAPLVADMSSDFLWRKLDVSRFGLVYAGAQKNIGPSGLVVVIVRDDLLGRARSTTPQIWNWFEQAKSGSMLNTPPTYSWYIAGLIFDWIADQGGVAAVAGVNRRKAASLYAAIDGSAFYANPVAPADRSLMNVPFTLANPDLDPMFLAEALAAGLVNLKGHRSVGGMRASIYNAMPEAGVDSLIEFMKEFESAHG
jgi:phosphoserine aminotransferase